MESFGKLMFKTHDGLRNLYNVSCAELDFLVNEAKRYPLIIGARLMGGGFGGCTINIIRKNEIYDITGAIAESYKNKFDIDAECYVMSLSDGTHEITVNE
jgi:galactokinase